MSAEVHTGIGSDSGCFPILLYHGIDSARRGPADRFAVSEDDFRRHMDLVAANGRWTPTISELAAALGDGRPMPGSPAPVTFDDGTGDFYDRAWPVLRGRGLTATLYVISGLVGKRYGGHRMLGWEQLEELVRGGVEIGAHSHRHVQLDVVPLDRAAQELVNSKLVLEDRLQTAVNSFSYPFGYHTAAVKSLVSRSGFTSACAVKNRLSHPADDLLALARLTITADTNLKQVSRLLKGRGAARAWTGERLPTRVWRVYRRGRAFTTRTRVGLR
jgi:peptidoglycan/xylan/chitin deacetylase (PgdA/CDA1 family)